MALPHIVPAGSSRYNVGGSVVQFDPTYFTGVVMDSVEKRLDACGKLFVEMAKANFVFAYPPHSMDWDFPHYNPDGETMKNHINYKVFITGTDIFMRAGMIDDDLPGRMSNTGKYPGYPALLETGTSKMAPRPWLTITTDEVWGDWATILTGMESL